MIKVLSLFLGLLVIQTAASATEIPRPPEAELYFITPSDGDTVTSPLTVKFGLRGMGVAPAGTEKEHTGHHHLLINAEPPPLDEPIPNDDQHRHFGGGQTEIAIELPPGQHRLQLVLGDANHYQHTPPLHSETITITVRP